MFRQIDVLGEPFYWVADMGALWEWSGPRCYAFAHKCPIRRLTWVVDYAGEAECVYERVVDGHERLADAAHVGATRMYVSRLIPSRVERKAFETLMRFQYLPVVNKQPEPTVWTAILAALDAGREDIAACYASAAR
jgi:hypothetical protein